MGKSRQLARPKKAEHVINISPLHLVYGDFIGPFKRTVCGGYELVCKITDQFTKWTAVYFLCSKDPALVSLQLFVTSTVTLLGKRIIKWRADKGGDFTGDEFKSYCLETVITQELAATKKPQQIDVSERVGQTLCVMVRSMLLTVDFLHSVGRAHDNVAIPVQSDSAFGTHRSRYCTASAPTFRTSETPARRRSSISKKATKLGNTSWEGMVCGFSRNKSNSFRSWNLKTLRVVEKRNGVFIETPPRLCPPSG